MRRPLAITWVCCDSSRPSFGCVDTSTEPRTAVDVFLVKPAGDLAVKGIEDDRENEKGGSGSGVRLRAEEDRSIPAASQFGK